MDEVQRNSFSTKILEIYIKFLYCNKVSKSIRVVTYFEVGREACSSQINASATTSTKTAIFTPLKSWGTGHRALTHLCTKKNEKRLHSVLSFNKPKKHKSSEAFLWGLLRALGEQGNMIIYFMGERDIFVD